MSSNKHVLTVISKTETLSAKNLEFIKIFITEQLKVSIISTKTLSNNRVYDFIVETDEPSAIETIIKDELLGDPADFDIIFQLESTRKNKKLFIFDMDSTLIYQEVIELIAAYANIEDKVAEITERAMNGEIDFTESLQQRVSLLKGIDSKTIWEELKEKIQITNGAKELCKALNKLDVVMGVCSGGFIPLAEYVKEQLGLHYAYANQLGTTESQILDGTTVGPIVNGEKKAELLLDIAKIHNINPQNAVAVGDGANDLKMMSVAGWGVAWNAKPTVQKAAPCCLNTKSLQDILYIMGYNDEEIEVLSS